MFLTLHYPFHTKRLLIGHKIELLLANIRVLRKFTTLNESQALKYAIYSKKCLNTGINGKVSPRRGFAAAALHQRLMHESLEIQIEKSKNIALPKVGQQQNYRLKCLRKRGAKKGKPCFDIVLLCREPDGEAGKSMLLLSPADQKAGNLRLAKKRSLFKRGSLFSPSLKGEHYEDWISARITGDPERRQAGGWAEGDLR